MTPEAAKKHRTEILAFLEGKPIQWHHSGEWHDCASPIFNEDYQYRVKPESRMATVWVVTWFGIDSYMFCDSSRSKEFVEHIAAKYTNATITEITREIPE